MTKEESQGEQTAPAPEFTAIQSQVQTDLEVVQMPSMPIQQFPTEYQSTLPATEDLSAALTAQATGRQEQPLNGLKLFFHKLLNKMEIRLTENKI